MSSSSRSNPYANIETNDERGELRSSVSKFDGTAAAELRNFSARLRRALKGQRPTVIARQAGIDEKSMRDYLAARSMPRGRNLKALASALRVSTEELLGAETHTVAEEQKPYGVKQHRLNLDLLVQVIDKCDLVIERRGVPMPRDMRARLYALTYDHFEGREVEDDRFEHFLAVLTGQAR
jgi:transcriptional regulator with XRE-family HTH domain